MTIAINIEHELDDLGVMLDKKYMRVVVKATKRTLTRAVKDAQPVLHKLLRKQVNVKKAFIKRFQVHVAYGPNS